MQHLWLLFLIVSLSRCSIPTVFTKFDCHSELDITQEKCEQRGCIYNVTNNDKNDPICYFKAEDLNAYKLDSTTSTGYILSRVKQSNPWGENFPNLVVEQKYFGSILNVKISPQNTKRFEPPVSFPKVESTSISSLNLSVTESGDIIVKRNGYTNNLFDTSIGGLFFSDQFIQIATKLPNLGMYGWGENIHQSLSHNFSRYTTWAMLGRDEGTYSEELNGKNLYGVHPFYLCVEIDGTAHGVLILNSNPQEVTTVPYPGYIYRTIGGLLDLYFFPGPTPEEVVQQYHKFIGKPGLPAYWGLGYQLSRYGYHNLTDMQTRVNAVREAGIAIDIAVIDIDYMDRCKDFTTGAGFEKLPEYIEKLHNDNMKLILIFDPAIDATSDSFKRALTAGAKFIEYADSSQVQPEIQKLYPPANGTKIMLGVVWPDNHVGFPDFFDETTQKWWVNEYVDYRKKAAFDGIWIDMNEPANFGTNEVDPWYFENEDHPNITTLTCTNNTLNYPPYKTLATWIYGNTSNIFSKTLCLDAVHTNGETLYNQKNVYGLSETIITRTAMHASTGKRGAVISRATFPSSGQYAGHWLGDNNSKWADLRTSIIGVQEFNIFGIPYVGADVCGFNGESNEELCLRWQQVGAFHPFYRNHNSIGLKPQDPAVWPSVANATRAANKFRYTYLPYLYSLLYSASLHGGTVIRPLFFNYPKDRIALTWENQFMWGEGFLIAPAVQPNVSEVNCYFPEGIWYSLSKNNYGEQFASENGFISYVSAPHDDIAPVFVHGGSIIPRHQPGNTLTESRKNKIELLIAEDSNGAASGFLYWDDGESIVNDSLPYSYLTFNYQKNDACYQLLINKTNTNGGAQISTLDTIEVIGTENSLGSTFQLNGRNVDEVQTSYNFNSKILLITKTDFISLTGSERQTLTWCNASSVATIFLHVVFVFSAYSYLL